MASSRNNKSKSSGLRILWIPGRRKHNPKGHFDSTSKQPNYSTSSPKKNQLWSLGGSKTHKNLIEAEPDTGLFDGPSVSGLSPLAACSITAAAATTTAAAATTKLCDTESESKNQITDAPSTPNSSSSTALLLSVPTSPEPITVTVTSANEAVTMPATKYSSPPITTTVAEIDSNRFAILNQNGIEDTDPYDLPTPPKNDITWRDNLRVNTSGDTTSSIATIVSSTSPNSETKSNDNSNTSSPIKKKSPRSHHSNQGDVNSIESISDTDQIPKLDLDWIDELVLEHNANEILRKSSKHKKKKQHTTVKELDQLDGVPSKNKVPNPEPEEVVEDDDKLVKCLYFTLMCCECSIS